MVELELDMIAAEAMAAMAELVVEAMAELVETLRLHQETDKTVLLTLAAAEVAVEQTAQTAHIVVLAVAE